MESAVAANVVEVLVSGALEPRDALALTAVGVPESLMAENWCASIIRLVAKLALATVMVPFH